MRPLQLPAHREAQKSSKSRSGIRGKQSPARPKSGVDAAGLWTVGRRSGRNQIPQTHPVVSGASFLAFASSGWLRNWIRGSVFLKRETTSSTIPALNASFGSSST